jgi:hypothetical protein
MGPSIPSTSGLEVGYTVWPQAAVPAFDPKYFFLA